MKIPMAGCPIVGLLVAPEGSHSYCLIEDKFSPDLVYEALGTHNFGVVTRYLGPVPLLLVYDRDSFDDSDTIPVVFNERSGVVIRGGVLIFGKDETGSFRSLSDFEIASLRDVTVLMRFNDVTYFALENLTRNPTPFQLASVSEDRPPITDFTISLMKKD